MKLFLAGNFPLLNDIDKERVFMNRILDNGRDYNRLVSFFYPKTCETVLTLRKEMKGKTQTDFELAREKSLQMAESLKKKFPWMKDFRFVGDSGFKPGRKKKAMKKLADEGEEVSFGLNMILTYENEKGETEETEVILRHKDKPFYDIHFKSFVDNPKINNLIAQWEDTWIILFSGGTIGDPKAVIVAKFGEYPAECFVDASHKGHPGRWKLSFAKWLKWVPCNMVDIFGNDPVKEQFEKIRKCSV